MRFFIAATFLLTGCQNECQQVCLNMADYAESPCKKTFPEAQIDACLEKYADATEKELATCSAYGSTIAEEWSCDDIEEYFGK